MQKRILVMGDSMSLAHVGRALTIANRLKKEGAEAGFDLFWKNGMDFCPEKYVKFSGTRIFHSFLFQALRIPSSISPPPEECPYKLEHLVMSEKIRKTRQAKYSKYKKINELFEFIKYLTDLDEKVNKNKLQSIPDNLKGLSIVSDVLNQEEALRNKYYSLFDKSKKEFIEWLFQNIKP
jgi:hypothetical protein